MTIENKGTMAATLVVAASDSLNKAAANLVCSGANDHIEIQEALDALPATGGEVFLLDGTYYIEATLDLDSYQTLRGCGRNTILTTTSADLDIIAATGGAGTEKVGILIADLCVDGNAGGAVNNTGILWTYVDHSKIRGVWSLDNLQEEGIYLLNCDYNTISGNICQGNYDGIYLRTSSNNIVIGNICQGNGYNGIYLRTSNNNTITGNNCHESNDDGILLYDSSNNNITCNNCQGNGNNGINLYTSNNNTITDNTCVENSQGTDNTKDNIYLSASDYNLIASNICRAPTIGTTLTVGEPIAETEIAVTDTTGFEVGMGVVIDLGGANVEYHRISAITAGAPGVITIDAGLANIQGAGETIDVPEARYGINISNDTCDKNIIQGNDLHDAGKTANFNDVGTLTTVQDDNRDIDVIQYKHFVHIKNTSGSQRVAGDVVIIKGIATAVEVTTTITQGDDKVYGMVAETIEDDASGYVQVKGFTADLKVDGTIDIAIDDPLGTFTTACIAMKAAAGDQVFALALEGYTDDASDGVIDAYIISPWD